MNFPVVSEELIESIRVQVGRSNIYYESIFNEMKEENPNLHEAIFSTLKQIYNTNNLSIMGITASEDNPVVVFLINNTLNLCACIYQSLKQQYICDELK